MNFFNLEINLKKYCLRLQKHIQQAELVNNTDKNQSNKLEVSKWLRNTLTALPKEYKADDFKNL